MKKETSFLVYLACLVCLFILGANFCLSKAKAQTDPFANLAYPIAELGDCADRGACKAFCANSENRAPCLDFAQAKNLLPKRDIEIGRKMLDLGEAEGPGGCLGMEECKNYCDEITNLKECIMFAEKNGLLPEEEMREAKKVIAAIDRGLTPPPCRGKSECDIYCSEASHMEECLSFGEAAGLIPQEELGNAKKMLQAIKAGVVPLPCRGKDECDVFCSSPENMAQCMEFALAAGFMPEQEMVQARKMLDVIKQGIKPPNCKGEAECQAYCQEETHFAECVNFAEAMGDMKPEDAERARKTGGKGPGGCKGEAECQNFCNNPENGQACLEFAVMMGEMSQEEAQRILEGNQNQTNQNMENRGPLQNMPTGPGGCQSPEECKNFCSNPANQQECANFAGQTGGTMPGPQPGQPMPPAGEQPQNYQGPQQYQMPQEGGNMPQPQTIKMPGDYPTSNFNPEMQNQMPQQPQGQGQFAPLEGQNYGPQPKEGFAPPQEYLPPQGEGYILPEGMGFGEAPKGATPGQQMPEGQIPIMPQAPMAPSQEQFLLTPTPAPAPEPAPAPASEPQSFLWPLQLFLSNILSGLGL